MAAVPNKEVTLDSCPAFILQALGMDPDDGLKFGPPPHMHPRICIISRTGKRFILNEPLLVAAGARLGLIVDRLSMESMTLFDQVGALASPPLFLPAPRQIVDCHVPDVQVWHIRRCAMVIGVHGSGIVNFMFMRPETLALQIMPYNIQPGEGDFLQAYAQMARANWMHWENTNPANTVFHWHFANQQTAMLRDNLPKLVAAEGLQGQGVRDKQNYFAFWLNQDTIVPVEQFERWVLDVRQRFRFSLHHRRHEILRNRQRAIRRRDRRHTRIPRHGRSCGRLHSK